VSDLIFNAEKAGFVLTGERALATRVFGLFSSPSYGLRGKCALIFDVLPTQVLGRQGVLRQNVV
jgi:hypothetical protein